MPRGYPGVLKEKGAFTEQEFRDLRDRTTQTLPTGGSWQELNRCRTNLGLLPKVVEDAGDDLQAGVDPLLINPFID